MVPTSLDRNRLTTLVGVVAAVVGLVGYVVFDWRFDGTSGPIPTALALVAVAIAIGATLLRA